MVFPAKLALLPVLSKVLLTFKKYFQSRPPVESTFNFQYFQHLDKVGVESTKVKVLFRAESGLWGGIDG